MLMELSIVLILAEGSVAFLYLCFVRDLIVLQEYIAGHEKANLQLFTVLQVDI